MMWIVLGLVAQAQAQDRNCNGIRESAEPAVDPGDALCAQHVDAATGQLLNADWYFDYPTLGCSVFIRDALDIDDDGFGYGVLQDGPLLFNLTCDVCPATFNPSQADSNGNGIGDACVDSLYLAPASNAVAGAVLDLSVLDAAPGATVRVAASTTLGSTPSQQCANQSLDLASPVRFDGFVATGSPQLASRVVPAGLVGQTLYLQAIDVSTCRVSNVVEVQL